jgi:hypothetical protein
MMAFSEIRSRIRGIVRNRHNQFLAPITSNQLLAAKSGTLEQEFQALCKLFGDSDLAIAQRDAAELAELRGRLRRSRRRRALSPAETNDST